jgi:hypothetical protein
VQNVYFAMSRSVMPEYRARAKAGDEGAQAWLAHFLGLGRCLEFAVDHLKNENEHEPHGEERQAA